MSYKIIQAYYLFYLKVINFRILYKIKEMGENQAWAYIQPFLVGSLSGSIASAVIQPIDTVKVIIQSKRESAGKKIVNLSPFFVGKELIHNNGVIGTL
jgi:hypothetical protein